MEFEELVKKRASVRNYSLKKPDITQILEIIETANLAPSPGNLPIIRYIIVEESERIEKIAEFCQQDFLNEAQFVVVICSDPKHSNALYDERSEKYVLQHAGAVIENFLLTVTDMGLASCWVGAFDETSLRHLLNVPDSIGIEAVLPIGYPPKSSHTVQKRKPDLDKRVFYENWNNKFKIKSSKVRREDL